LESPIEPTSPPATAPSFFEEDRGESPIHAEVKLLVRTSDNGRESVEIRSVKEHVVPTPPSPLARSPVPPPQPHPLPSPVGTASSMTTPTPPSSPDSQERVESPSIITQKLVVRFHDGT